jgi:hypothetical protein
MSKTQGSMVAKSAQLQSHVDELLKLVGGAIDQHTPIHEVERKTLQVLLQMGRTTLQILLDELGSGDVGESVEVEEGKKTLKRSEETGTRKYTSIFGTFELERYVYAKRTGAKIELVPLDARLGLPESKFSYLLQDWDQSIVMEEPFEKAGSVVEKILSLHQHVDSLERMNRDMAESVDEFHKQQSTPPASEEGPLLVQTADGKGVPIRRAADAAKIESHDSKPGPKPGAKRMATLGSVYSIDPYVRTSEEIVEALFCQPSNPRQANGEKSQRPRPQHKRVRACLDHTDANGDEVKGAASIFGWIADEVAGRNRQDETKTLVSIMDGQESLWSARDTFQAGVAMVDILDLLHVTPRLWKAAKLFHTAGSDAATKFVRERVSRVLRGEVSSVIVGLRRLATTHKLRGKPLEKLETIVNYFVKNQGKMKYNEYLAAGYPIASGVIEGACRHVVKDRLERTGMSWTIDGAQSMLSLRCIHLCGEWDTFTQFRIHHETERLHPHRNKLPNFNWAIAT